MKLALSISKMELDGLRISDERIMENLKLPSSLVLSNFKDAFGSIPSEMERAFISIGALKQEGSAITKPSRARI